MQEGRFSSPPSSSSPSSPAEGAKMALERKKWRSRSKVTDGCWEGGEGRKELAGSLPVLREGERP